MEAVTATSLTQPTFWGEHTKEVQDVVRVFNEEWGGPKGFYKQVSEDMPFLAKMAGNGTRTFRHSDFRSSIVEDTLEPEVSGASGEIKISSPVTELKIKAGFSAGDIEQLQNRQDIEKLVSKRAQGLMDTAKNMLGEMMFGTGMAWDGKAFNGMQALLNAVDGGGKVMGIDASLPENAWWRNQVIDLTTGRGMGPNGTRGDPRPATPSALTAAMDIAYQMASHGGRVPDCIVTDCDTYELYEQSERGQCYKGIEVMFDRYCPPGMMYMIRTDQICLRANDECNLTVMNNGPIWSRNQTVFSMVIGWTGQIWMENRRNQAAMRISVGT